MHALRTLVSSSTHVLVVSRQRSLHNSWGAQRSYTWTSELRWERVNGFERTCHVNLVQPHTHDTPPAGAAVQAHLDEDSAAPMRRAAASCVYG
jgi:hypothetical protein